MHITFYCDSIPFHLDSLITDPLGGTESSVLSLSKELANLNYSITIIGKCPTYHKKHNIEFIPTHSVDLKYLQTDTFISVRDPEVIVNNDLSNFKKVIFWSHDVVQHPSMEHLLNNTRNIIDKIDYIVVLSDYVYQQLNRENHKKLLSKTVIIRNGIDSDFLHTPTKNENTIKCVYHSMPYRGLVYLLEMWSEIKKKVDNIELDLYTGNEIYGQDDTQNFWMWNKAKRHGIEIHSPVSQSELLKILSECDIHLYPTDFVESSCTATMMSLASGCAVIATDLGALREQINIQNGTLIYGHPGNEKYQNEFIESTVELIRNKQLLRNKQQKATDMRLQTWKNRAIQWTKILGEVN